MSRRWFCMVLIVVATSYAKEEFNAKSCNKLKTKYEKCLEAGYNSTYECQPFVEKTSDFNTKKCNKQEKSFFRDCVKKGYSYVCRNETEVEMDLYANSPSSSNGNIYITCVLQAPEKDPKLRVSQNGTLLNWKVNVGNNSKSVTSTIFGTTSFGKSNKEFFECYSKKYKLRKTANIKKSNNTTVPFLHIRAPSSIQYGQSSSVTCSVIANSLDPEFAIYWNGQRILPSDQRFRFSNYTYSNKSVATSIEGFVEFNSSIEDVQVYCTSPKYDLSKSRTILVYTNKTRRSIQNVSQRKMQTSDITVPFVHIRAPSSIQYGDSASITCSLLADNGDPKFKMFYAGDRIYRGDPRFSFKNYTYRNGSVKTSIEGFVRFNASTEDAQVYCVSSKLGVWKFTYIRVYTNNTNATIPFLHIKAPSSIRYGQSSSVTCSVIADSADRSLYMLWNGKRIKRGDHGFKFSNYTHRNGSVETSIKGFPRFNFSSIYYTRLDCFSTIYKLSKGAYTWIYNVTEPVVHIRAPLSIDSGESSSVTCSITADEADPTLYMYWNNSQIYRGDSRFKFGNRTHKNGSVETYIAGFPQFNVTAVSVLLFCNSQKYFKQRKAYTYVYGNNVPGCWNERRDISSHVLTLSNNETRDGCGRLCLSDGNCIAVQFFRNGTCLATHSQNPVISEQWLIYTAAVKTCTLHGGKECYVTGRLHGDWYKRENVNSLEGCVTACNNDTLCTGMVSFYDIYCDLYSGPVELIYQVAAVALKSCLM